MSRPQPAKPKGDANVAIAVNRRALHEYEVLERYEAGIELTGTEIKSIRLRNVQLREAFVRVEGGEAWLYNAHIARYLPGHGFNHEPTRRRRLLFHRSEIREVEEALGQKGVTAVPLSLYLKRGMAKVEVGVVRGRKAYDKRRVIAEREAQRQMQRALRHDV